MLKVHVMSSIEAENRFFKLKKIVANPSLMLTLAGLGMLLGSIIEGGLGNLNSYHSTEAENWPTDGQRIARLEERLSFRRIGGIDRALIPGATGLVLTASGIVILMKRKILV